MVSKFVSVSSEKAIWQSNLNFPVVHINRLNSTFSACWRIYFLRSSGVK